MPNTFDDILEDDDLEDDDLEDDYKMLQDLEKVIIVLETLKNSLTPNPSENESMPQNLLEKTDHFSQEMNKILKKEKGI